MKPTLFPLHSIVSLLAATGLAGSAYATELVPLLEFENASDFTQNFSVPTGFQGLSVAHSDDDDGGIGRGGFVTIPSNDGTTSNLIYDTDGVPGTQAFGDVTMTVDHRANHSVGFIIRGTTFRSESIRVLFTGGARVRVWTGSNVSDHEPTGELHYDETGPSVRADWSHLRLDARNGGAGGNQIELVFRAYDSQVLFDENTLVAEHVVTLSVEDSTPYLGAGEIGLRMLGVGTRIDNFAVYEYGTAPSSRSHPDLSNFNPVPNAQFHDAANGFSFHAATPAGIDSSNVSLLLNGTNVSGDLVISGDPNARTIQYFGLESDIDYVAEIEVTATSGEITTRRIEFNTDIPPIPVPLINLIEFAEESEFTGNFTVTQGSVTYQEDWDQGIGRGGTARTLTTSNFVYDTDVQGDTQTFQDFSATVDHRSGPSLAFIIRANRDRDESIRVMLTNRNRIRVWTGSSLSAAANGQIQIDETIASGLSTQEWVHLRLDVRNIGEVWDRQIEIRLRAFGSQTDLTVPAFEKTFAIPSGASFNFLEAGEIGFRAVNLNDIDNFGVYEYGTAPVRRPHPEIQAITPEPSSPGIGLNSLFSFEVTGMAPTPQSGIRLFVNSVNVTSNLAFAGDDSHWFVTFPKLQPGDEILIEAANAEATTTAFFDYPPVVNPFEGRVRHIYNSGGFQDDGVFPQGDLLNVQHGNGEWTPHPSNPAQLVTVEDPFNRVLRISTRNGLNFPEINTGTVTLELDVRVSSPDVRTLDLSFTSVGADGTQRSFVGWGTVPGAFTYYDGSSWIPVFQPGSGWHHYRMVNYLTGPYASTFDLFVDGTLVGEKLPFRSTFDRAIHVFSRIRFNASSGANYAEIDNLVVTSQPLMGRDQLPYAIIHEILQNETATSISFNTYLGYNYLVEYQDALDSEAWTELATAAGNGKIMVVTDPAATGDRRFYRVTTLNQ